jgi:FkbM family methyltransferase
MLYFDIGANVGNWSKSNINLCDKIISIEASHNTFKILEKNCKNNKKIIILNYAVCNNNCNDITFYDCQKSPLSTINKDWLTNEKSRFNNQKYIEITCKTITIDKLIEKFGLPDLIKIDVEGGEYECIVSLNQKINLICFEWASEMNDITFKCIEHLVNLGYTQYYIQYRDDYLFRPKNNDFYDIFTLKTNLSNTIPKKDWGMIWCK